METETTGLRKHSIPTGVRCHLQEFVLYLDDNEEPLKVFKGE